MVRDYSSGIWQLRHILRDNQGSIVAIADTAGNVIERNDYDPWGVRRQPQTQTPFSPGEAPELLLGRGYCGHEHLTEFGLINMNARLFDPALCRFLSPDPIIQAPDNSQNFNRYSYCLNNPLRYTDPTGMVSYDYKNWSVDLDEVVVTAKRRNPFGVNVYIPTIPEWYQYYYNNVNGQNVFNTIWNVSNQVGGASGKASGTLSLTALLLKYNDVKATYIIKNSKEQFRPKIYFNGWHGNQYVKPKIIHKGMSFTSKKLGAIAVSSDFGNILFQEDFQEKLKSGVDLFMDALGQSENIYAQIVSAIWSLGGRDIFWDRFDECVENEVRLYQMGISGYCTTMPFK